MLPLGLKKNIQFATDTVQLLYDNVYNTGSHVTCFRPKTGQLSLGLGDGETGGFGGDGGVAVMDPS